MVNSRDKGARAERTLANKLKEYGYDTRRGQQFCGLNGQADVVGLPNIHIECKRVEQGYTAINSAMAQSIRDSREGETPVVMHKQNRKPWLVTMTLEDWIKLYEG